MKVLSRGADAYPGSALDYHTGGWRDERPVHRHRPAPCHGACPAGEDPQAYIAKVQEGRLRDAWEILVATNPLPAVTGRVCHHPCEAGCNRGRFDEAVAIHGIERFLGDEAIRNAWDYPLSALPAGAPSVAVVGAGPAGVSAAYHLRRRGHRVTLFDRYAEAGGMLRAVIPAYRLPRDVLDAEVGRVLAVDGIEFRGHQELGEAVYLDDLRRTYAAVFLAPGCHKPAEWSVGGARPADLHTGLDLLKEWVSLGVTPVKGKRAVVHGGGNTAVDVARILRWSGASEVHVVTASALPDDETAPPEDRMSAFPREVAQAREEGIVFHPHHTLTRLVLREGRTVGVEIAAVRKLAGDDGRVHRVSFEGTEKVLRADHVVPATGEVVDPSGLEALIGSGRHLRCDAWGRIEAFPGVFGGGDALGDRGTVSHAIGDGRRGAEAIARWLQGVPDPAVAAAEPIGLEALNLHYFDHVPRHEAPVVPAPERTPETEIEGGLDRGGIDAESARCFSCGNCLACDNCWTFCPEPAVLKTQAAAADGSHYVFDLDYCKGCGLCARECPTGYIAMIGEPAPAAVPLEADEGA